MKLNFRRHAGLVLDFGGGYGNVLLGPEIRPFARGRVTLNARALIGALYVDDLKLPLTDPRAPVAEFIIGRSKPLAGALGGSLDYRINRRVSLSGCSSPTSSWFRSAI